MLSSFSANTAGAVKMLYADDPQYLAPDEQDLFIASHIVGKPCPFCGSEGPIAFPRFNRVTGIYGYTVNCSNDIKCGASIHASAMSRNQARDLAFKRWNTRVREQEQ
jgi:hypothetical protein